MRTSIGSANEGNEQSGTGKPDRRLHMLGLAALLLTLLGCKTRPRTVSLDVVTFNYLDRPIFQVLIDGRSGDSSTAYPQTGGSTISGVKLKLGPKHVTRTLDGPEGTPRNGETVTAKNELQLIDIPRDHIFLAIHIYPDETVELLTSLHYPRATEKGTAMATARQ